MLAHRDQDVTRELSLSVSPRVPADLARST
jgi:hypothetical protein